MALIEPITTLDILFDMFAVIFVLCIVGYSSIRLLEVVSRRRLIDFADQLFEFSSDYTLKLNFFLYIGIGFTLICMKVLSVFRLVNSLMLWGIVIFSLIVILWDLRKEIRKNSLNALKSPSISRSLRLLAVTFVFLFLLSIFKAPAIIGEYGSTEHDATYHSLLILDVLKNQMEVTSYPQGSHMVAAFLTTILNIPVYRIVSLLTLSFSIIIFLGFYSLAVTHLSKPVYGYLLGCLGCLFWYGGFYAIAWGGLSYMFGIYIAISSMAFSTKIIPLKDGQIFKYVFYVSLLFVPLFVIYPVPLLFEALWLVLLLLRFMVTHRQYRLGVKTAGVIALCLVIAVIPWMNYISLIFPGLFSTHGVGALDRPAGRERNEMFHPLIFLSIKEFKDYTALYGKSFELIPYGMLACIAILIISYIWKHRTRNTHSPNILNNFSPTNEVMFLYYVFLVIVYLYIKYVDAYFFFPTFRVFLSVGIIIVMLEALSIVTFWTLLNQVTRLFIEKIGTKHLAPRQKAIIPKVFVIALIFVMFVTSANLAEPLDIVANNMLGLPGSHSVLTKDDIELQLWMKKNIPYSIVIMASCADAGQYVPIIAEKEAVVGYGPYKWYENSTYGKLLYRLSTSPDQAFEELKYLNITHLYIGAKKTEAGPVFNSTKIQSTQNNPFSYRLVHKVGNAYLFEIVYNS